MKRFGYHRRAIYWPGFLVFVAGMYLAAYGSAGCQHSRWETRAEAARIVNVYHPWAIILGLAMVIVGLWSARTGAANSGKAPAQRIAFDGQAKDRGALKRFTRGKGRG